MVPHTHLGDAGSRRRKKRKGSSPSPHLLDDEENPGRMQMNLFDDIVSAMSSAEKKVIEQDCDALLAKISNKNMNVLSMNEMVQIVEDWKPKQEILCLYIRIARKLPSNFHLDSVSTLLCLSKQCGYTPVDFITKTKCLQIAPSKGKYPFKFTFKTASNTSTDGGGALTGSLWAYL